MKSLFFPFAFLLVFSVNAPAASEPANPRVAASSPPGWWQLLESDC
jgi:hypothetical protein